MNNYHFICLFATIVAFVAGFKVGQPNDLHMANYNTLPYKIELIKAYNEYTIATEQLLESLDNKYNWKDTINPQEYYEVKDKLDKLANMEE